MGSTNEVVEGDARRLMELDDSIREQKLEQGSHETKVQGRLKLASILEGSPMEEEYQNEVDIDILLEHQLS